MEMKKRGIKSLLNSMINNKKRKQLVKKGVPKRAERQQHKLQQQDLFWTRKRSWHSRARH